MDRILCDVNYTINLVNKKTHDIIKSDGTRILNIFSFLFERMMCLYGPMLCVLIIRKSNNDKGFALEVMYIYSFYFIIYLLIYSSRNKVKSGRVLASKIRHISHPNDSRLLLEFVEDTQTRHAFWREPACVSV